MTDQGEALLFLQPHEMPYIDALKQKGVELSHAPMDPVLDSLPGLSSLAENFPGQRQYVRQEGERHPQVRC